MSVTVVLFSDISYRSINKDQFQRKKNDTLDPELYVLTLFHSFFCLIQAAFRNWCFGGGVFL